MVEPPVQQDEGCRGQDPAGWGPGCVDLPLLATGRMAPEGAGIVKEEMDVAAGN